MTNNKLFSLTLDLENDWHFGNPEYDHLVLDYLDSFINFMKEMDIPLSIFVVGRTLEKFPNKVDDLDEELDCEFHLHSYRHDVTKSYDFREEIREGKHAYREHFGYDPSGYRAPQGNIDLEEFKILHEEGFSFDSSIFPTYRPGIYNNLRAPLTPYRPLSTLDLIEIPIGVFRGIRIPISQSYFKLFGRPLGSLISLVPFSDPLVYNLHLHDLYETASHDALPPIKQKIHKRNIEYSIEILRNNVERIVSNGYKPVKISDIYLAHKK
jgi:hypothetical protein